MWFDFFALPRRLILEQTGRPAHIPSSETLLFQRESVAKADPVPRSGPVTEGDNIYES
jgi:hypothetical protein